MTLFVFLAWVRARAAVVTLGSLAAALLGLLAPAEAAAQDTPAGLRGEAFEAAQWAVRSEAAEAMSKVAARFARGGAAVSALAALREQQLTRRQTLERAATQLARGSGAENQAAQAANLRAYQDVERDLARIDAKIEDQFPAYAELTNPSALSIEQTQALLQPDEVLVLFLVNPEATYIWAVSRDKVAWTRAEDLGEKPLTEAVIRLRRGLTAAAGPNGLPLPAPFDVALAYHLYDRLLRPLEPVLKSKTTLIAVPSGPLLSLPIGVLLTGPPTVDGSATNAAPTNAAWLADSYAVAVLPAVSSLRTLRCYLLAPGDRPPSGCPQNDGGPTPRTAGRSLVPLVGFGAPQLFGLAREDRGGDTPAASLFVEGLADRNQLLELGDLPAARVELTRLGAEFPGSIVRLGADATETAVKVTYKNALMAARYVIFSTHGILGGAEAGAGGARSYAEPGLVLTPPQQPSDLDDGYLSASEIAELRLSADFVVLSACNTAGSDGRPNAEGLSGLARAFLFAGSRSVLVSNWEVSDIATTDLILRTFKGLRDDSSIGRAEALRRAMQELRSEPGFAHPYFWAPFVLVGDPRS
ncbi:MAG TPA: CHAT domain-containing protein [Caulobacteraceae bacterium]|nr:CHAT domain-containing protein [Caulobacteraceae bacterium]